MEVINPMSRMVRDELKGILPYVLAIDAVAYLVSFIFLGVNYEMALGLILGSILLLVNMALLGGHSEQAINIYRLTGDVSRAKRKMAMSYAIRSVILAAALFCSLKLDFLNTVGVMIPFLYPKPVYMIKTFISDKKEGK